MNPTPTAKAAIQAYVPTLTVGDATGWAIDAGTLVSTANAATIANPTTQGTVPVPFTVPTLFALLSTPSLINVRSVPYLPDVRDKITSNDVAGCTLYAELFAETGVVTPTEGAALLGVIQATQLDPSWPALISWAEVNIGRDVDSFDIAAVQPGGPS